ncbi:MAG: hypothetical protein P4L35_18475 [Ignavibacteriaceae bacterium]|nr:hypothetical protein [Ignavibacteriaceae bacterium]
MYRTMKWFLFLSSILTFQIYAQQHEVKSVFVSANLGIYNIADDNFSKVYDSNMGFAPAISLGLPLSTRTYIYAKASYFIKNGVPYTSTYSLVNGQFVLTSEKREGTATFRELILNTGLLTKIFLSLDYTLGLDGGLTFVSQIEKSSNPSGTLKTTISEDGLMGFFVGCMIERNFGSSPFSLTGDIQYNLSIRSVLGLQNNGGVKADIGLRYYFKERRLE